MSNGHYEDAPAPKLPSDKIQKELQDLQKNVKEFHDYFSENMKRYSKFRRFALVESLSPGETLILQAQNMPNLEFNICEAYISRLLGELMAQEPAVSVHQDDEFEMADGTVELVEAHMRHVVTDPDKATQRNEIIKDLLTGGYSAAKVSTDYAHPLTFRQNINVERLNPIMCGWDILAQETHKGDGEFCYECFPMDEETFKRQYPKVPIESLKFTKELGGFSWSYKSDAKKIIIVCEYFKKKRNRVKIVELSDGTTMKEKDFEEKVANWDNDMAVPPVVTNERTSMMDTICRYVFIENKVLEYSETDYRMLPIVFFDGNSVTLKEENEGNVRQITKPYVYNVMGAQKLKNYSGNSIANEIENIVQHKIMVAQEALPQQKEYLNAYTNVQQASTLVFNAFYEKNPMQPIPNPIREVIKTPAPPEIFQTFSSCDQLMQSILGNYDSALGINKNELSGIAIVESSLHSNAAALPFVNGYLQGIQRVAQIYVDLMPKYFTTPRTIPVMDKEGKRDFVKINQKEGQANMQPGAMQGGPQGQPEQRFVIDYEENALNVRIEAGASFQVQKSRALQQINAMMQASPSIAEFFSTKGLPVLFDNMDIRGIDRIKEMADEWIQEKAKEKEMAMKAAQDQMGNNPAILNQKVKMMEMQQKEHLADVDFEQKVEEIKQAKEKMLAEIQMDTEDNKIRREELDYKHRELDVKEHLGMHQHAHTHAKDVAAHHLAIKAHESADAHAKEAKKEGKAKKEE